ncbi:MAG: hypothetical protein ACM3JG_14155 [Thiohalocapsa sp.]
MLEYEWRELERLCERLADLRHREAFAQRSKNVGLLEGLREDIVRTRRQREQLVQHISARLGVVSAAESGGPDAPRPPPQAQPPGARPGPRADEAGDRDDAAAPGEFIGFLT